MIGRNLAIENSFFLQFANASMNDFTINLFNAGGQLGQTPFETSSYWIAQNKLVNDLLSSVFINNTTIDIIDDSGVISSVNMLSGQTTADYEIAANPVVDGQGNLGQIRLTEIAPKFYSITITGLPTLQTIKFGADPALFAPVTTVSYAIANPFITCFSTIPIEQIQRSETGNSYHIMGMDILSSDPEQITQSILYGRRDANGDIVNFSANPLIDPYQENAASIHALEVGGLIIDTETNMSYVIRSMATSRLTFNYVKASLASFKEFDQAFISELAYRFLTQRDYLRSLRYERQILIQ